MIVVKADQTEFFENSPTCSGYSFPSTGQDINGALITIKGRYPEKGFVTNEICKELAYITSGNGILMTKDGKKSAFMLGDVVFIDSGEVFAWEGEFSGFFATTPTFDTSQHKEVSA